MNNVGLVLQPTGSSRGAQLQGAVVDDVVGEAAVDGHLEDGKGEAAPVDGHLGLGAVGNELLLGVQSDVVGAQVVLARVGGGVGVAIVEDHPVLAHPARAEVVQRAGGGDGRQAAGRERKADRGLHGEDVTGVGQHRDVRLLHQLAPVELVGGQVRLGLEVDLKARQRVVAA